ncbi:hypothetical protein BJ875DRAFT_289770 [Amylocarpus encephaloides]|uniref:Uncharacterized protein n=1 Tax=Amylocarpus encephaloides TaxID=45428 RepID=A0A9P7YK11_9HELO|nr:hypothetical protein BJ875DRAFT_289770 [Amylocarpus encephaloides]
MLAGNCLSNKSNSLGESIYSPTTSDLISQNVQRGYVGMQSAVGDKMEMKQVGEERGPFRPSSVGISEGGMNHAIFCSFVRISGSLNRPFCRDFPTHLEYRGVPFSCVFGGLLWLKFLRLPCGKVPAVSERIAGLGGFAGVTVLAFCFLPFAFRFLCEGGGIQ